ncbi:hypothetical protein D3C72_1639110 [compost metagenome]
MRVQHVLDEFINTQRDIRRRHGIDVLDHANHRPAAVLLVNPQAVLALQQVVKAQLDTFKTLIVLPDNTDQPGGILAHRVETAEVLQGTDAGQTQLADVIGIIIFDFARQIDKTLVSISLDQLLHLG